MRSSIKDKQRTMPYVCTERNHYIQEQRKERGEGQERINRERIREREREREEKKRKNEVGWESIP